MLLFFCQIITIFKKFSLKICYFGIYTEKCALYASGKKGHVGGT
jgi:hypothetical protein